MADLETAVYSRLSGYAGLTALVGTRVYPVRSAQPVTLPAVVYQRISGVGVYSHEGDSGLSTGRVQVDSWAATYAGVKALAAQVKAALSGYTSAAIGRCHVAGERDLTDTETGNYRVTIDFMIGYRE